MSSVKHSPVSTTSHGRPYVGLNALRSSFCTVDNILDFAQIEFCVRLFLCYIDIVELETLHPTGYGPGA